jgi:hypothetical protein
MNRVKDIARMAPPCEDQLRKTREPISLCAMGRGKRPPRVPFAGEMTGPVEPRPDYLEGDIRPEIDMPSF